MATPAPGKRGGKRKASKKAVAPLPVKEMLPSHADGPLPSGRGYVRMTPTLLEALFAGPNSSEHALDCHDQRLCTIAGLAEYTNLRSLDLSFNVLDTLEGLDGLKQLRELRLYHNKLCSLDGIAATRALEHLHAHDNLLTEISPEVSTLRNLKLLRLDRNRISAVQHLGRLGNLTYLDLSRNRLTSAAGIKGLRSLETLILNDNQIADFADIGTCPALQVLHLDHNRLASLKGLSKLKHLTELHLNGNRLPGLRALGGALGSLDELYLAGNALKSLADLARVCPSVSVLDLRGNTLTDVAGLAGATELTDLWLGANPVCKADGLADDVRRWCPTVEILDDMELVGEEFVLPRDTRPPSRSGRPPSRSGAVGRPPSAGGGRPPSRSGMRPPSRDGGRPGTADGTGRPLMRPMSARTGPLQRMASTEELESTLEGLRQRMVSMRQAIDDRVVALGGEPTPRRDIPLLSGRRAEERPEQESAPEYERWVPASSASRRQLSPSKGRQAAEAVIGQRPSSPPAPPPEDRPPLVRRSSSRMRATLEDALKHSAALEAEVAAAVEAPQVASVGVGTDPVEVSAEPPAASHDVGVGTESGAGVGPVLKRVDLSAVRPPSAASSRRTPRVGDALFVPEASPRFVPTKTAEKKQLPRPAERKGFSGFRIPPKAKEAVGRHEAIRGGSG